jgi:hypothetical protein
MNEYNKVVKIVDKPLGVFFGEALMGHKDVLDKKLTKNFVMVMFYLLSIERTKITEMTEEHLLKVRRMIIKIWDKWNIVDGDINKERSKMAVKVLQKIEKLYEDNSAIMNNLNEASESESDSNGDGNEDSEDNEDNEDNDENEGSEDNEDNDENEGSEDNDETVDEESDDNNANDVSNENTSDKSEEKEDDEGESNDGGDNSEVEKLTIKKTLKKPVKREKKADIKIVRKVESIHIQPKKQPDNKQKKEIVDTKKNIDMKKNITGRTVIRKKE